REVLPIGATRPVPVDVRLVTATHRNLETLVEKNVFRGDLLARVAGATVRLPPLRARRGGLGLVVATLLRRGAPGRALTLSPDAVWAMLRHDWPLNIRELEKCLGAASVLGAGERITAAHLSEWIEAEQTGSGRRTLTEAEAARRDELVA